MTVFEYLGSLLGGVGLDPTRLKYLVTALAVAALIFYSRPFLSRLGRIVEQVFLQNWQLGLLGTTGLVLSLASGWTTWDGMKNFTGDAILSAMVTFGIQGVMLIVAWLIGESFATGMNQRLAAGSYRDERNNLKGTIQAAAALTLAGLTGVVAAVAIGFMQPGAARLGVSDVSRWLAIAGAGIMAVGLLIVASHVPTLRGYFDAMRVIVRSAMLWVMFLACMATSVFFSFDSLFSTIFPASERVRAAELRAQNQVAGIAADISQTITHGLLAATDTLFGEKGWVDYDNQLSSLSKTAQESREVIEAFYQKQMEANRTAIAAQQERIATANSSAAGLVNKKTSLTDELARLKADRPGLADDFAKHKGDVDQIMKDLDAKRVEAMAEGRGVEGTGKVGEGPMFRQRKAEEAALKDKLSIAQQRLSDAQKRFQQVDSRATQIERELSLVDGDIAKLKGETQTAEQRIKLAEDAKSADEGVKLDPSRILPQFEKARAEFRERPTIEGLQQIQSFCSQIVTGLSTPATKKSVENIDCDPKTAAEAASRVFALNAGRTAFDLNCAGGDKITALKGADALFEFARKCVQELGLGSKDTDALRQKINFIELNRDDKANRFVVTWNAFQDGNRLAYLSLAIAIAVDGLVFLSGLFGANAIRSPLSDVPSPKARSADDLDRIIDNALLPHRFENARIVIEAMHADTSVPGYTAHVDLRQLDPESATVVRRVLNAGATIGAVLRNPDDPQIYAIRPELFEHLSITGARAFERHGKMVEENIPEKVRMADLERQVRVALLPDEQENVEAVLYYAHPINVSKEGFMSEIIMDQIDQRYVMPVRSVLNVGASHNLVQREKGTVGRYEIHGDLYKTLSKIRGRLLASTAGSAMQLPKPARSEGQLREAPFRIVAERQPQLENRLTTQAANDPGADSPTVEPYEPATPYAVEQARQKQNGVQQRAPNDDGDDPALEDRLVEHFARYMGLKVEDMAYVREHGADIDVDSLGRYLNRLMALDGYLRQHLKQSAAGFETGIQAARETFAGPASDAGGARARLDQFARFLKGRVPLLMLMPGQAYRNTLAAMSAMLDQAHAAGRLNPHEASLRDLVRRHLADLAKAERSDDHWGSIAQALDGFANGMESLAATPELKPAERRS